VEVETEVCEKVEVARIVIERVDGEVSTARVSSMEAADRVLSSWASSAPDSGYDLCDFRIVFQDGFSCSGHYYLKKSQKRVSLARHIRKNLNALAANDERHAPEAIDRSGISRLGKDVSEAAQIALQQYNI
jgi:hypothetical protein